MPQATTSKDAGADTCNVSAYPHHVLLRTNRFRYPGSRLLLGRARLFGDRIELSGWTWRGRHRRCLALADVTAFEYHLLDDGSNLTVALTSGEEVALYLEEAHRWREFFENWLRYEVLPSAKLLPSADQAASLAG